MRCWRLLRKKCFENFHVTCRKSESQRLWKVFSEFIFLRTGLTFLYRIWELIRLKKRIKFSRLIIHFLWNCYESASGKNLNALQKILQALQKFLNALQIFPLAEAVSLMCFFGSCNPLTTSQNSENLLIWCAFADAKWFLSIRGFGWMLLPA